MKKVALLSLMTIVFIGDLVSQAPNLMSYQAVIWDANGNLVSEKMVNIKISILQGSVSGTSVYSETHKIQTNINGLVSLTIGGGTNATGKISDINWGGGSYFLKTETDPTGGGNYSISGISQLVSVPYSFFSGMTGNIQTTKPGLPGQVLKLDEQGNPFWSGSSFPIVSNQMVSLTSCTASITVNVSDDGGSPVTSRGVVWSTSPNPTITSSKVIEGNGKGSFSTTLPNLAPNTTYYMRAFATNEVGTGYGSEIKVTTFSGTAIPTVTTIPISEITSTTAKSGGIVTGDCGSVVTARGVVWSTSPNPTISLTTKTSNGSGIGSFTSSLTGLTPNTTYYVKAYATNSSGTGYGDEVTFKTSQNCSPNPVLSGLKGICKGNITLLSSNVSGGIWSSSNPSIATINSMTGSVTGLNKGCAKIDYFLKGTNGCPDVNSSIFITIDSIEEPDITEVNLPICVGKEAVIRGEFKDFSIINPSLVDIKKIDLIIDPNPNDPCPPEGRTINNYILTGKKNGFTTITMSYGGKNSCPIKSITKEITVLSCNKPTVITLSISSITSSTASLGGNVTSDGGSPVTSRGIVWSINPNPTISLSTKTNDGTGIGSFNSIATNLIPNTTYYVKAYATNIGGTNYGSEITFKTIGSSFGIPCNAITSIKDIDGNSYKTVQIGSNCWMSENLRTTKYQDGTNIPIDLSGGDYGNESGETWSNRTSGARTIYGNNTNNLTTFGYLYNWFAAVDPRGLCPKGWRLPTDSDWDDLTLYLGGESQAVNKMKVVGTTYWESPNLGATNESGFTGFPGGSRWSGSTFQGIFKYGTWWTSSETGFSTASRRAIFNDSDYYLFDTNENKKNGLSVRCVIEQPFTSNAKIPDLVTTAVSLVTSSTTISGGKVLNNGGTEIKARGVVWSTSPKPDITLSTKTFNGSGEGTFISILNNLSPNTTYYLRAYATNSLGTNYGSEIIFKTAGQSFGVPCASIPNVRDIDGNLYNTVQIGFQCWLKENLRTTKYQDGSDIPLDLSGGPEGDNKDETWSSRTSGARTIYGNNQNNLTTYGYLYNWFTGIDPRGLCPKGWIVPSYSDWNELIDFIGDDSGGKLKSVGTTLWKEPNLGASNESGFSALPGGVRGAWGSFFYIGNVALFMNTLENHDFSLRTWDQLINTYTPDGLGPKTGFSVRCKKAPDLTEAPKLTTIAVSSIAFSSANSGGDISSGLSITARGVVWSTNPNPNISLSTKTLNGPGNGTFKANITGLMPNTIYYLKAYATNSAGTAYGNEIVFKTTNTSIGFPCSGTSTVKDIDGNIYNTTAIGTQCWMKENLRTTKYRDGTIIPMDSSGGEYGNKIGETWSSRTIGARTINRNNFDNLMTYGYLYNWYSVNDNKGLCPVGWSVPSDEDWTKLTNFLGYDAGGKMKTTGTTYWRHPNLGATDEVNFSALPGGYRSSGGDFYNIGFAGNWWSSTSIDSNRAWSRWIYSNSSELSRNSQCAGYKKEGLSVRCIKN